MPIPEKSLISRIRAQVTRRRGIVAGIGDDSAILKIPAGHEALVTTDFSLEGVHFRREWHSAEVVGHRCLTRGLSDIAAMGGTPFAAFLSLAVPKNLPQKWIDRFVKGLLALAEENGVTLAGGDTAQSPDGVLADIVVLGSAPKGRAVRRSRARPGDLLYVTGSLGAAAAALNLLFAGRRIRPDHFQAHFCPSPRIEVGRFLAERGLASAMIDLSDGLSTDLAQICDESGVGAEVQATAIPCAIVGKPAHEVDLRSALHGGDDYELLFTTARSKRVPRQIAGVPVTQIGRITRGQRILLVNQRGTTSTLRPQGWEHFK